MLAPLYVPAQGDIIHELTGPVELVQRAALHPAPHPACIVLGSCDFVCVVCQWWSRRTFCHVLDGTDSCLLGWMACPMGNAVYTLMPFEVTGM